MLQLVPESAAERHSSAVGELFLMLHQVFTRELGDICWFAAVVVRYLIQYTIYSTQNINFLEKLEFTDPKLRSILLLKFVQVCVSITSMHAPHTP